MKKSRFSEKSIITLFTELNNETHLKNDAANIEHHKTTVTVSQDTLNDGVHFDVSFCDPVDIAHRAFCANASDMAAMGLGGTHITQSLSLPQYISAHWLEAYAQSLLKLCNNHNIRLIGGDTTRAERLSITLTILNIDKTSGTLSRLGVKPNDHIYLSKEIGNSQLGLKALQTKTDIDKYFIQAYLQPKHEIPLGKLLLAANINLACMDISDGLLQDLQKLCDLNHVNATINIDAIPEHPLFAETCLQLSLDKPTVKITGGEDYALLIIGPKDLANMIDKPLHLIGQIGSQTDHPTINWVYQKKPFHPSDTGFNHFAV